LPEIAKDHIAKCKIRKFIASLPLKEKNQDKAKAFLLKNIKNKKLLLDNKKSYF
jgi:hypothetical protein